MSANSPLTDMAAVIAGELAALAADAKTLAARLSPGDIVSAVVLPSNGLTDLLDIGGLRVAAELPPNLLPGETVTVEVVGFRDDRINLQVISTQAGSSPAPLPLPPPPATALPAAERIRAAVRRPLANVPAPAPAVPPVAAAAVPPAMAAGQTALEARLAASHAMNPAGLRPAPVMPSAVRPLITMRPAAAPGPAPAPAREPGSYNDPATLLRALQLPVTATNVTLARMALETPDKLPNALRVLGRALRETADPRLTTLDALASFVAELDPRSPVLATQIASYVDHVVTGREAKIAQLLGGPESGATPVGAERVAAGWAALEYDLKSQLLAVAAAPAGDAADRPAAALAAAVTGALTAITAVQLKAAAAPSDGLSFTLPISVPDGSMPARVRVRREPRAAGGAALEHGDLSVSLAAQTRTLGPVEVEFSTNGGALALHIGAADEPSRQRLERGLDELRSRLEHLDLHVDAVISVTPSAPAGAPTRAAAVLESMRHVDVDA